MIHILLYILASGSCLCSGIVVLATADDYAYRNPLAVSLFLSGLAWFLLLCKTCDAADTKPGPEPEPEPPIGVSLPTPPVIGEEGWVAFEGSACPFEKVTTVEIFCKSGVVRGGESDEFDWEAGDIVAWRTYVTVMQWAAERPPQVIPQEEDPLTPEWTEREKEVILGLSQKGGIPPYKVLRQALRCYQERQSPERPDLVGEQQLMEAEADAEPAPHDYRLEPEPEWIELGPEDVPPLSLLRKKGESQPWHWRLISYVLGDKMVCADRGYPYSEVAQTHEINRPKNRDADGNPTLWEPCRKPKPQQNNHV